MDETAEEEGRNERLTMSQRVGLLERDVRSHARSITEIVHNQRGQATEIATLSGWKMDQVIQQAVREERDKNLLERIGRIEESIQKGFAGVQGFGWRIFWIVMGTVIPAAVVAVAIILANKGT